MCFSVVACLKMMQYFFFSCLWDYNDLLLIFFGLFCFVFLFDVVGWRSFVVGQVHSIEKIVYCFKIVCWLKPAMKMSAKFLASPEANM